MWILGVYFLILLAGLGIKIKNPQSKLLMFFRAFFPSWKFFENTGDHLNLYVMSDRKQDWKPVSFQMEKPFYGQVLNPQANDLLARRSLLEHLIQDLQNSSLVEVENLTSFRLVQRLAQSELRKVEPIFENFKFKILVNDSEECLISDWQKNV